MLFVSQIGHLMDAHRNASGTESDMRATGIKRIYARSSPKSEAVHEVRVRRLTIAADAGLVINPETERPTRSKAGQSSPPAGR